MDLIEKVAEAIRQYCLSYKEEDASRAAITVVLKDQYDKVAWPEYTEWLQKYARDNGVRLDE